MKKTSLKAKSQNLEARSFHKPVLLNEVIDCLCIQKGDIVLDATINGGGHSSAIADRFGKSIQIIGLDADAGALLRAKQNISGNPILLNYNFRRLDEALAEVKTPKVNRIIFDLGLSSDQLEQSGRGFSFQKDEPLLMTFDKDGVGNGFNAGDIVNKWEAENIATIIKSYGEERYAKRIADAIVLNRAMKPITTSKQLAEIIKYAVPVKDRYRRVHPATKTFQALRIAVNDELEALKEGLAKAHEHLERNGRLAVISFHSLEDRIVKHFMREKVNARQAIAISKKPITASSKEVTDNPRSRSAKLRIIEKL
ncbi:MAG: 16S rRNA (cytosine(1402)-N(4))-methyltransferase RsmH [bacterium]|nr:16S rRNA (cytosine(1402)-N(4))-methyltransferase RsmH [bacterium]